MAAVAVFCFPVLVATWSRAAWVAVAVAAACLLWKAHRRMVLWGMGVAVCAGVAAYFLKQGSADGRLLMTMVAGRAAMRRPTVQRRRLSSPRVPVRRCRWWPVVRSMPSTVCWA